MNRLRAVALLARMPGLLVLREALLRNPAIEVSAVYTHGRAPKAEGAGARPELEEFRADCAEHGVRLTVLDGHDARDLESRLPLEPFDLMVSLSWRFILPRAVLARARVANINLHRGALPEFRGAEPVRRAIEAGERRVAITAHRMIEEVDAGPVVATVWHDIETLPAGTSAAAYAETVKAELLPLYAPLARLTFSAVSGRRSVSSSSAFPARSRQPPGDQ
jgi:methionyl-tRNA formyltransferase